MNNSILNKSRRDDSMKFLSIIIMVDQIKNINELFGSILNQSIGFNNLDIILLSTQNISDTINDFIETYSNVRVFVGNQNTQIDLLNTTLDDTALYFMLIKNNVILEENACELLYDEIIGSNSNFVSGNYTSICFDSYPPNTYIDNDKNHSLINAIENKLFKKEFVINNNINFNSNTLFDLNFVLTCIELSKEYSFVDYNILTNYYLETILDKEELIDKLNFYKFSYKIIREIDGDNSKIVLDSLKEWTYNFILSSLDRKSKIDILSSAKYLFNEFDNFKELNVPIALKLFFKLMINNQILEAVDLTDVLLDLNNLENEEMDIFVKNKDIFMIFIGLDFKLGGIAKAVFTRANLFSKIGFNVTLLNIDPSRNFYVIDGIKDFKGIESYCRKQGYLDDSVALYNSLEYYSKKNTIDEEASYLPKNIEEYKHADSIVSINQYIIEKIINQDESVQYNFYDKSGFTDEILNQIIDYDNISNKKYNLDELSSKQKLRSEKYIKGSLVVESIYKNIYLITENLYTPDGFNYFSIYHENGLSIQLNDRFTGVSINFNNIQEFNDYFLMDLTYNSNKPFMINDCSGIIPSIGNLDSKYYYKIANIHSNPYKKPYNYGSNLRDIGAFNNIDDLDVLITLTKSLKNDLKKEFKIDNIFDISNFINFDEEFLDEKLETDKNKISVFSRLSKIKNLEDIIKAFSIVIKHKPKAKLNIYGRAINSDEIDEEKKLRILIRKLNLEENVHIYEHIENVYNEMKSSLVTVMVSHSEGMGLVILESMYNGVPVVSYDFNYGPSELIDNGVNGYLVKQYDVNQLALTLIRLLNNPKKAKKMGINARNKVLKEYSNELILLKWVNILKKTVIYNKIKEFEKINKEKDLRNSIQIEKTIVYNKNEELSKLNEDISDKNQLISEYKNQLDRNEQLLIDKTNVINTNLRIVDKEIKKSLIFEKQIYENNILINKLQEDLKKKNNILNEYIDEIKNMRESLDEKDIILDFKEKAINSQLDDIHQKNAIITNKEKEIVTYKNKIKGLIEELNNQEELSEKSINLQKETISNQKRVIRDYKHDLKDKINKINEFKSLLEDNNSILNKSLLIIHHQKNTIQELNKKMN